ERVHELRLAVTDGMLVRQAFLGRRQLHDRIRRVAVCETGLVEICAVPILDRRKVVFHERARARHVSARQPARELPSGRWAVWSVMVMGDGPRGLLVARAIVLFVAMSCGRLRRYAAHHGLLVVWV